MSVSPSGPVSSARRDVVVLALEEFEEFVTFELGVGADILSIENLGPEYREKKRVPLTPCSTSHARTSDSVQLDQNASLVADQLS